MRRAAMLVLAMAAPAPAGDDLCCGASNTFWGVRRWPSVVRAREENRLCGPALDGFLERQRYGLNQTTSVLPQYHLLTGQPPNVDAFMTPEIPRPEAIPLPANATGPTPGSPSTSNPGADVAPPTDSARPAVPRPGR